MTAVGSRVFAIRNVDADTKTVFAFGGGIYVGDEIPPGTPPEPSPETHAMYVEVIEHSKRSSIAADFMKAALDRGDITPEQYDERIALIQAELARPVEEQIADLHRRLTSNPRIDLDNGGTTWGFECWWGPEDKVLAKYPTPEWTFEIVQSQVQS